MEVKEWKELPPEVPPQTPLNGSLQESEELKEKTRNKNQLFPLGSFKGVNGIQWPHEIIPLISLSGGLKGISGIEGMTPDIFPFSLTIGFWRKSGIEGSTPKINPRIPLHWGFQRKQRNKRISTKIVLKNFLKESNGWNGLPPERIPSIPIEGVFDWAKRNRKSHPRKNSFNAFKRGIPRNSRS